LNTYEQYQGAINDLFEIYDRIMSRATTQAEFDFASEIFSTICEFRASAKLAK
jgi:hypothetical protein